MVEGEPKKPRVWLQVSQRKIRMMIGEDVGGVKGICMKICDSSKVDEPCMIKKFLENEQIQWLVNHVFWRMVTFLYGLQQTQCRYKMRIEEEQKMKNEEDQNMKIVEDKR
jgi:hypothetical protein